MPAAALVLLGLSGVGTHKAADAQAALVAFGDSYVHPAAASYRTGQRPWVLLVGEPVRNLGHAGDQVARTLTIVRRAGSVEVAVVEVGINDVRRSGTDPVKLAAFGAAYAQLLDRLASAREIVVVPPLPILNWGQHGSELALLQHRQVELELAAQHPNVRVADPIEQWHPDAMLVRDGLHPNALGRAVIASAVRTALAG